MLVLTPLSLIAPVVLALVEAPWWTAIMSAVVTAILFNWHRRALKRASSVWTELTMKPFWYELPGLVVGIAVPHVVVYFLTAWLAGS